MEIKFTNHFFLSKKKILKLIMRTFILLFCTTVFSFSSSDIFSQNTKIVIDQDKTVTIDEIFDILREQTEYTFIYQEDLFKNTPKVRLKKGTIRANKLLKESLSSGNFNIDFTKKNKIIVIEHPKDAIKKPQVQVTGTIVDASGQPLPGANILEKGTTNGTQSDFDGKFALDVAGENAILVVSYIGFATKEVTVGSQTNFSITLDEDAASLDEIVVVGYGTQRKKDLTGAVASIGGDDVQNSTQTSVDQMMQGKVAGVRISQTSGQPGGGVSIRIRGNSSLNLGNDPLYVIDGMPIDNSAPIVGDGVNIPGNTTPPNPLNSINPQDIESIQVLKDASATAIYGSRGANGVILITTKSGKEGVIKIDYNTSIGFQKVANRLNVLDSEGYVQHVGAILQAQGGSLLSEFSNPSVNTDWQDEIFESAIMQQHNISFSGGSPETKYFASFNYTNQDGILKGSGFERYGGRLNWGYKKNKFTADVNINTSFTADDITAHGDSGGNFDGGVISTAVFLPNTVPVFNSDGSYFQPDALDLDNPYNLIQGIDIQGRTHRTLVNLKTSYEVVENLKASVSINTDVVSSKKDSYRSRQTVVGSQAGGIANIITSKNTNYVVDALLNYNNTFGDHTLSALAGYTYQKFNFEWFRGDARGFIGDEVATDDLGAGNQEFNGLGSFRSKSALLSYLSRVNYSFKDKFLVTASVRIDGSSRFTEGNKYGTFPSFSLGYRISEEDFMASQDFVSNLKMRLGWGQIGNSNVSSSASLATFVTGDPAVFNNQLVAGLTPARIPNSDLTWETTEQLNFGLDFGLFNNRISGSIDIYNKKTKDLLFFEPVPLQTGFSGRWVNLANSEITNSGLEISLNSRNITSGDFSWETDLNMTTNKNEITDLGGREIINNSDTAASVINREGEAAFSYFGLAHSGIWQTGEDPSGSAQPDAVPGQPKWIDQDNDGDIDGDDRVILGNPYPDFTWGFNNVFKYKGFELSVFVEGVHGVELFNNQLASTYFPFNNSRNRFSEPILNRWTTSNPTNDWPSFVNPSSYGGDLTNRFVIQDASFVRLKNITFKYNFDLKDNKFIRSLNAYVSGQNLAISTDYLGFDPDLSGSGNSRSDFNSYPTSRTFLFGVNIGF